MCLSSQPKGSPGADRLEIGAVSNPVTQLNARGRQSATASTLATIIYSDPPGSFDTVMKDHDLLLRDIARLADVPIQLVGQAENRLSKREMLELLAAIDVAAAAANKCHKILIRLADPKRWGRQ